jgi:hypothetical protein
MDTGAQPLMGLKVCFERCQSHAISVLFDDGRNVDKLNVFPKFADHDIGAVLDKALCRIDVLKHDAKQSTLELKFCGQLFEELIELHLRHRAVAQQLFLGMLFELHVASGPRLLAIA